MFDQQLGEVPVGSAFGPNFATIGHGQLTGMIMHARLRGLQIERCACQCMLDKLVFGPDLLPMLIYIKTGDRETKFRFPLFHYKSRVYINQVVS